MSYLDDLRVDGIIRWKIGPYDAFGRGISLDENNNTVYHLLEQDDVDHSPQYGSVDVVTEEERLFESNNLDVSGNVDYPNNIADLTDLKEQMVDEPVYVFTGTESFPLVINTYHDALIVVDESSDISFKIISKDSPYVVKATLTTSNFTLKDYSGVDRLTAGYPSADVLKSREVDIDSLPVAVVAGDILVVTYTYFHHSDMARDEQSHTAWSSAKGYPNTFFTIDLSPYGSLTSLHEINNIEVIAPKTAYPLCPREYILQVGVPNVSGNIVYRIIASGRFPTIVSGESHVIKFDRVAVRYLRLVVIGANSGDFASVEMYSSNPALASQGSGSITDIEVGDYYSFTIVPYYVDASAADVQSTIVTGTVSVVSELAGPGTTVSSANIARSYIPKYNIYDLEERQGYILSHYDIRVGNSRVYRGMPSPFLGDEVYTTTDLASMVLGVGTPVIVPSADVYLPFSYDLVSRGVTTLNETFFNTTFRNIEAGTFTLKLLASSGVWYDLTEGAGYDYEVDYTTGRVKYYAGLGSGDSLYAYYGFKVVKTGASAPEVYLTFLRTRANYSFVSFSGIRVYPSLYFKEFIPNTEIGVYEFEINPNSYTDKPSQNQQLVKLLDGSFKKQKFGDRKVRISISGPKISNDMYNQLRAFSDHGDPLGLVTDTLDFYRVTIVPDSLQGVRRQTSVEEYDNMTTTWSYSIEFQEI